MMLTLTSSLYSIRSFRMAAISIGCLMNIASIDISKLSILLIEPSVTQNKIIVNHLRQEGIQFIDGVCSGAEGLRFIHRCLPDLVISSMYLSDMTATELITRIRQQDEFSSLPFMLISSETSFKILDPIRQAGVVAILPKPFDHADLKRALRSTLEFIDPEDLDLRHYEPESLRVLVVDDSVLARKYIKRVLENMGISRIVEAADGNQGVAVFSEQEFDLVITDYNMPEMDGKQLIECIRQDLGNAYIPILMVTSEQDMTRLSTIEQAGVSAICDKPFEPNNVKEMLVRMLDA